MHKLCSQHFRKSTDELSMRRVSALKSKSKRPSSRALGKSRRRITARGGPSNLDEVGLNPKTDTI